METSAQHPPSEGLVAGGLIGTIFGLVFIEVNSGGLPGPWSLIIRIVGAVIAVALFIRLIQLGRPTPKNRYERKSAAFTDRRYWLIVAVEVVALFGGLAIINGVLELPKIAIAWIALVVGVHFLGWGRSSTFEDFTCSVQHLPCLVSRGLFWQRQEPPLRS